MEVLFAFAFDDGVIYETKNTLLPSTAPKDEKFQWFLKTNDIKIPLEFSSRTDTTRTFKSGIVLDIAGLVMSWNNENYKLTDVKGHSSIAKIV